MIKMVTPTPIFPLFLLSKGNSIWLPRWPKKQAQWTRVGAGNKKNSKIQHLRIPKM